MATFGDFRLILKSRLVSESNHLGVCFWGERRADFRYGDCVLVIPPHGGMWDYRPGKGSPPRENIPHTKADPHQWHETEVLGNLNEGTLRMAVNGIEIVRYKDEDPARLKRGPIGLQIHSGASIVEYKDIEVEIDPKETTRADDSEVQPIEFTTSGSVGLDFGTTNSAIATVIESQPALAEFSSGSGTTQHLSVDSLLRTPQRRHAHASHVGRWPEGAASATWKLKTKGG